MPIMVSHIESNEFIRLHYNYINDGRGPLY